MKICTVSNNHTDMLEVVSTYNGRIDKLGMPHFTELRMI